MIFERKIYKMFFSLNIRFNQRIPKFILNDGLPDFLVIGAAKCATTFLKENLRNHPEIYLPRYEVDYFTTHHKKGVGWYRSHFWTKKRINGEISPSYIYNLDCHERIHELLPDAKLILLLRDPVYRAFSNWNMRVNNKSLKKLDTIESDNFDELVAAFSKFQREDSQQFQNPYDIFQMGKYIIQIENLLQYFNREQLFIGIIEDITLNEDTATNFFERLYDFLGVSFNNKYFNLDKIRAGTYQRASISEVSKNKLKKLYHPYNKKLFEFLGYEIKSWYL